MTQNLEAAPSDSDKVELSAVEVKDHILTWLSQREDLRNNNPDITPEMAELERKEDLEVVAQYGEHYEQITKEGEF